MGSKGGKKGNEKTFGLGNLTGFLMQGRRTKGDQGGGTIGELELLSGVVMPASGARAPPTTSTARWGRSRPLGGESLVETNLETRLGEMKQSLLSFRRMQAVFSQMESRAPSAGNSATSL